MWPVGCSSTEFSQRAVDVGQTFNSQNMNWNDCIGKVTLFGVMRIGIFDDRNVELVYSGVHKNCWPNERGAKVYDYDFDFMGMMATARPECVYIC